MLCLCRRPPTAHIYTDLWWSLVVSRPSRRINHKIALSEGLKLNDTHREQSPKFGDRDSCPPHKYPVRKQSRPSTDKEEARLSGSLLRSCLKFDAGVSTGTPALFFCRCHTVTDLLALDHFSRQAFTRVDPQSWSTSARDTTISA